ncbi:MAG TPA: sigma factor, partial [Solirubrobacterales bacterium]|nr:sigma factor [Solirubrobacterales bacterium]
MRGVAVQGTEEHDAGIRPDEAARKRVAVELIRNHDRPLRWTARRYSICPEDAEDAYQRGIEILLSKAPTTDTRHLLPWTRKVIKHEALAIRRTRERT